MFVVVDRVVDHHCMTFTDLIGSVLILEYTHTHITVKQNWKNKETAKNKFFTNTVNKYMKKRAYKVYLI
jgi:hypothetical protein